MAERSLQQLLVTNFDLSPSGYTGSQGDNGYTGSIGPAGANGAGVSGPRITSIGYPDDDTAADVLGGDTITLTGANFASGAQVIINGNAASVVSVVNSTTITFTAPPNPTGSYILYVLNTDGATTIAVPGLQYSGTPAWSTAAGSLGTTAKQVSFTSNLVAIGDAPVTYSLYSGSLPSGLTLSANTGVISGTTPDIAVDTTYNFTIRATDAQRQDTNRSFSLTIQPALYDFTSFTFTNTSSTSQTAPTKSTLLASYNTSTNPWLNNTAYFDVTAAGFQLWTVPVAGTYRIQCTGASGGTSAGGGRGGYGAIVTADIALNTGDKYRILVGHRPAQSNAGSNGSNGGAGGGASAFWKDSAPTTPIIVAGAGGGGSGNWSGYSYANQPGQDAQAVGAAGGVGLGPGTKGPASTGGNGGIRNGSGAPHGAGWLTAGDGYTGNGGSNGARLYDTATGGGGGDSAASAGFGGGGGGRNTHGGGAGGYNGGSVPDSGSFCGSGGGGSSYVGNGATLVSDVQTNTGHGSVLITKL